MDTIEKAKCICTDRWCYDCPLQNQRPNPCCRRIVEYASAYDIDEVHKATERIEKTYAFLFGAEITVTESDVIDMLE